MRSIYLVHEEGARGGFSCVKYILNWNTINGIPFIFPIRKSVVNATGPMSVFHPF